VVRHQGRSFRSTPLSAHVAYLERDGVTRDGEKGCMFGATEDRTNAMAFARRKRNDRHHFRFIVTPEDAAEMTDLTAFTATSSPRRSDGERSRHQAWGWHRAWEHRHPHPRGTRRRR
jgi:type IV secretory pathway VirD2 relaxase